MKHQLIRDTDLFMPWDVPHTVLGTTNQDCLRVSQEHKWGGIEAYSDLGIDMEESNAKLLQKR